MRVRLTHIDGKLPNLALMKLAHYHRARGDELVLTKHVTHDLWEPDYDVVYGSAIFSFSAERVEQFKREWPRAIIGGTHNVLDNTTVEQLLGIDEHEHYDYSIYPDFESSIGFTQRGCRLKCGFCVVPKKEGKPRSVNTINDIWRGAISVPDAERLCEERWALFEKPDAASKERGEAIDRMLRRGEWPRHLHLLDNDFFGQPVEQWQARIQEIKDGGFKVCLNQGINTRMIDDVSAKALASIPYYDDSFTVRRLYTAWDNIGDEERFFRGVDTLERHGVPASNLLVYMLIGYDKRETWERVIYRLDRMIERKIRPYPMVYGERDRTLPLGGASRRLARRSLGDFQRYAIRRGYTFSSFEDWDPTTSRPFLRSQGELFTAAEEVIN